MQKAIKNGFHMEINGLRAIAVLLVLVYHIDNNLLPGGFLGVDVFLVISGFLISRNIYSDLQEESFSFATFYKKRIKRLFPVLGVTLFLTLIAGYFILTPYFFQKGATSAIYALLSGSNFLFFFENGYFNVGSELKPLLHTWSLGLEEQFYLVWPLLLFIAFKLFKKRTFVFVLLISVLSLIFSEYYLSVNDQACFYLIPFRIFEFGIGASAIWLRPSIEKQHKGLTALHTLIGMVMIAASAVFLDKYIPMPGIYSLAPCLGALLIMCAGSDLLSKIILENKLAEIIGRASYSIYLVHWPLIVYYKLVVLRDLSLIDKVFLFVGSLIMGILLWRIVEVPFKKIETISNKLIISILTGFLSIGLLAGIVVYQEGFGKLQDNPYYISRAEMNESLKKYRQVVQKDKKLLKGETQKEIVIIGNSHAIDLIYALRNNGYKHNITYLSTPHTCYNFGASSVKQINYIKCQGATERNLSSEKLKDAHAIFLHDDYKGENWQQLGGFIKQLREITDAPIYVIGPKMVFTRFADVIIGSAKKYDPATINKTAQDFLLEYKFQQNSNLNEYYSNEYFAYNNIVYLDVMGLYKQTELVSSNTAKLLYFDSNHYTEAGSLEFGQKLRLHYPEVFE